MMAMRILTAAIALPVLIFIVWLGGLWFAVLIALAAGIGAWELCRLATAGKEIHAMPVAVALTVVLSVSYHFIPGPRHPESMEFTAMIPALAALLAAVVLMSRRRIRGQLGLIVTTLSIGLIIGGTLFHAPLLRDFEWFSGEVDLGARWIFFLLGVTFVADSVGYFANRTIGSRWLNPEGRWRGAVGGILAAVVCGVFLGSALNLGAPAPFAAIIAVILAVTGKVGALFIAKMKRMAGLNTQVGCSRVMVAFLTGRVRSCGVSSSCITWWRSPVVPQLKQ